MDKNIKLGDFLLWEGMPAKVIGETRERMICIELYEDHKCPHCKGSLGKKQIYMIPTSPLFKEKAILFKKMDDILDINNG